MASEEKKALSIDILSPPNPKALATAGRRASGNPVSLEGQLTKDEVYAYTAALKAEIDAKVKASTAPLMTRTELRAMIAGSAVSASATPRGKESSGAVGHSQAMYDDIMHFFLHRQGIDTVSMAALADEQVAEIANVNRVEPEPGKFDGDLRQQGVTGEVIKSMDELFAAATEARDVLNNIMVGICQQLELPVQTTHTHDVEVGYLLAPLKSGGRAKAKAASDYAGRPEGPAESWLYDIVRGQVVCASEMQIVTIIQKLQDAFNIVRIKNRFRNPTPSGFRDLMINVQIEVVAGGQTFKHVCELQIHHIDIKTFDLTHNSHGVYEKFREHFAGGDVAAVSKRMQMMANIHKLAGVELVARWPPLHELVTKSLKLTNTSMLQSLEELLATLNELQLKGLVQKRMLELAGDDSGAAINLRLTSAVTLREQGKYDEAFEMLKKCVEMTATDASGGKDVKAKVYIAMSNILNLQHKHDEAMNMFKLATTHYGETPSAGLAVAYNGMGETFEKQNKRTEAMEMFQKSVDTIIAVPSMGNRCPEVGSAYQNIGALHSKNSDHDKAEEFYKKALAIKMSTLGAGHSDVANIYNNLSIVLKQKGQVDESLTMLNKSYTIKKTNLGPTHPMLAGTLHNLGLAYKAKGELEQALVMFDRCLAIRLTQSNDVMDLTVAPMYSNMGLIAGKLRKPEALEYLEKAVEIYKEFQDTNPRTKQMYQANLKMYTAMKAKAANLPKP